MNLVFYFYDFLPKIQPIFFTQIKPFLNVRDFLTITKLRLQNVQMMIFVRPMAAIAGQVTISQQGIDVIYVLCRSQDQTLGRENQIMQFF